LRTISRNNPRFAPRIESIARAICPERANSGLWEQALLIGECATVLGCVQAERIALIDDAEGAGSAELEASQCKPPHSGMSLKSWALPHGTLIGSNL
jgi:hypothetical protein